MEAHRLVAFVIGLICVPFERISVILVTALLALLGGVATYFISGHALRPIREFSEKIEEVQAQNLADSLKQKFICGEKLPCCIPDFIQNRGIAPCHLGGKVFVVILYIHMVNPVIRNEQFRICLFCNTGKIRA